jgi:hypothetical protein
VETVIALDSARLRVEELGVTNPGEYLIYCTGSGDEISINAGRSAED